MNPITPTTLLESLRWRYATKKFDATRHISPEVWDTLEQALVLSPSSFGLQPWKFVVITKPDLKAQLVPASWGQTQPAECSHLVVFTVRRGLDDADVDRFLKRTTEALAGYRSVIVGSLAKARAAGYLDQWQTHQVYIALGQFMTSAALLGVDTCPMEGIEPGKYDEILGLVGTGYATAVVCAAGYRSESDKYAHAPKVRFAPEDVIIHRA
ncbi:MAG: NAD(P)H-dependent oxidoreductase [Verrucomicrobia bacterium]|nr:NAD(P)H-dependent oxidoreductase [Verrucomicrobiota bacterium]